MYEGESDQLSKVMRKNKNPKSVPIVCDKCSYESEVSMKQWEEHWHGVEYKCPKCSHTLMQEDKVLQSLGKASGAIKDTSDRNYSLFVFLVPAIAFLAWILLVYLAGSK